MKDALLRAMDEDGIVGGDFGVAPVLWQDIEYRLPYGRLIAVRTKRQGTHLHSMLDKAGNLVPWHMQDERWAAFAYDEVTHWVRLA